jgi:hypothetical protein
MNIENFDDLLRAALAQPDPQCLLLVFVRVELPEDSSESERADFDAGYGGALVPVMSVDLAPERLVSLAGFDALCAEADQRQSDWQMVLAGALSGRKGQPPEDAAVVEATERLLKRVAAGEIGGLMPFNRAGEVLNLTPQ